MFRSMVRGVSKFIGSKKLLGFEGIRTRSNFCRNFSFQLQKLTKLENFYEKGQNIFFVSSSRAVDLTLGGEVLRTGGSMLGGSEGHLGQVLTSSVTSSPNQVMQLAGNNIMMHRNKLEPLRLPPESYRISCTDREPVKSRNFEPKPWIPTVSHASGGTGWSLLVSS